MKKLLPVIFAMILCISLLAGCNAQNKEIDANVRYPLPQTVDVNDLKDCTVAVSLEKGNVYMDDNGKAVMGVTVYAYDLYDMVDIATLEVNDVIVRLGQEVTVEEIERLDSGLININGGEENGGFSLISNNSTVYYEVGMSDIKAYYELGEVTLPVSDAFVYVDESDLDAEAKTYSFEDLLTDDSEIEYDFSQNNTSIVIENGEVVKMTKVYMP